MLHHKLVSLVIIRNAAAAHSAGAVSVIATQGYTTL